MRNLCLLLILVITSSARASLSLDELVKRGESIGQCSYLFYSPTPHQVFLPSPTPIKHQGAFGSCGFETILSRIEHQIFYQTGHRIQLSSLHIFLNTILDRVSYDNKAIEPKQSTSSASEVVSYIREHGLVPHSLLPVEFNKYDNEAGVKTLLKDLVDASILAAKDFPLPNDYDSVMSVEVDDDENADGMQNDVLELQDKYFDIFDELTEKKRLAAKKYIESRFGFIPDTDTPFVFESEKLNPLSFVKKYLPDERGDFVKHHIWRNKSNAKVLSRVMQELDNKRPVPSSMIWDSFRIDYQTGLISRKIRNGAWVDKTSEHAILIVGYAANDKGELQELYLQNSWGSLTGIKGYFRLPAEEISRFLSSVELVEEPQYGFLYKDESEDPGKFDAHRRLRARLMEYRDDYAEDTATIKDLREEEKNSYQPDSFPEKTFIDFLLRGLELDLKADENRTKSKP